MSQQNRFFVPGEGISRDVIQADIAHYLGPDALVRPGIGPAGEYEGVKGYWTIAYRSLTSPMIADLKEDSQEWREERERVESTGRYEDSRTYRRWRPVLEGPHEKGTQPYQPEEFWYGPSSNPTTNYGYTERLGPERRRQDGSQPPYSTDASDTASSYTYTGESRPEISKNISPKPPTNPLFAAISGTETNPTNAKRKFAHTVSEDCTSDPAARQRAKFIALGSDSGPRFRFLKRQN